MVYGVGMGNGDFHSPHDLMNLGLSLLDKVGVERASIGDSTGRLVGL